MTNSETIEVINALRGLPPEKVAELRDFALFLRDKYGKPREIQYSDEWSEEDLADASNAVFEYAYKTEKEEDR